MNQSNNHKHIGNAINILASLGIPRAQQSDLSAENRRNPPALAVGRLEPSTG